MLDKKGRLFGLINIIDLAVFALAIVLVIGFFNLRAEPGAQQDLKTVRVTVVVPYVHPDAADDVQPGDQLVARGQFVPVYVKDVKVRDALQTAFNSEGTMVLTTNPFRKDLVITIEGKSAEIGPELSLGFQQIRIGLEEYIFKTQFFEKEGEITGIEIVDGAE